MYLKYPLDYYARADREPEFVEQHAHLRNNKKLLSTFRRARHMHEYMPVRVVRKKILPPNKWVYFIDYIIAPTCFRSQSFK